MEWLIYSALPSGLGLAAGELVGTVEAPNRCEAQRRAAAGFFASITDRGVDLIPVLTPHGRHYFWPILIPPTARRRGNQTRERMQAFLHHAFDCAPHRAADERDAAIMLRLTYARDLFALTPSQRIRVIDPDGPLLLEPSSDHGA